MAVNARVLALVLFAACGLESAAEPQGALPFPTAVDGLRSLELEAGVWGLQALEGRIGLKAEPLILFLPDDLVLDAITADELLGSDGRLDSGVTRLVASGFAASAGLAPAAPAFNPVVRSLDDLWLGWFRRQDVPALQVQYEVRGGGGRSGYLTRSSGGSSRMRVTAQPAPLAVVGAFRNFRLVQGGVRLVLSFEDVDEAGDYSGSIVIVFNNL